MFAMADIVRMPIFVLFGSCEQNFTSKILQVGEKEKEPKGSYKNPKGILNFIIALIYPN